MDYLIRGGTVLDGTGNRGYRADVAISGDKIEAIEKDIDPGANGCVTLDATGKVVCPGIVDAHSHADMSIHIDGHEKMLEPLVRQGITTFIGGNCGMSMAPLTDRHPEELMVYLEGFTARELDGKIPWKDTAGFIDHIEKNGVALNTALLAPHGLIRIDAMGMETRYADRSEIDRMRYVLEQSLEAGAIGLSTGLQYMPGLQSSTRELVSLGEVVKKYDGIYASHLRSYMSTLPRAVDEIEKIASRNDIRAQISHIFWVPDMGLLGPVIRRVARAVINLSKYWTPPLKLDAEIEKLLGRLLRMRRRASIGMDVMPTTTTFTHLMAYFPPWAIKGTKEEIGMRLASSHQRQKMRRDIENGQLIWPHTGSGTWSLNLFKLLGWKCTRIMSVVTEENKHMEGRRIFDIAEERGMHPFDLVCELMIEEEGRVLVFSSVGEPEDNFTERSIFAALKSPAVSVSTDTILMGVGRPSHLFYGAYPKFFSRYVREMKMMPLETAVHKVTGLPAGHFGLKKRGELRKDWFADVLVFDPDTIEPNCDFNNPRGLPSGIDHVFVNGRHVVDHGKVDFSTLPGRVLKR